MRGGLAAATAVLLSALGWASDGPLIQSGIGWAGEMQEQMPEAYIQVTVGALAPGQSGWTESNALCVDSERRMWLDGEEQVAVSRDGWADLRVWRDDDGLWFFDASQSRYTERGWGWPISPDCPREIAIKGTFD